MKLTPGKIAAMLAGAGSAAAAIWVYRDYQKWLALGPGGLPYNFGGWISTTRMRLRAIDPLDTGRFQTVMDDWDEALLEELPSRQGQRPSIGVHPVPHRQLDQLPGENMKREIVSVFDAAVARSPEFIEYQLSHFEKRHPAITLRRGAARHAHAIASRGEVAHVHPSDGSMHMIFSSRDAAFVIERGWGESHPLAGVMLDLPETYLLIYPPRDPEELAVTERLLEAAIAHMARLPQRETVLRQKEAAE